MSLDLVASVMLNAFGKGEHQAMCKMSDGWYYASDNELEILRSKYIKLAEKVARF
jgi:hypothetical protein